jgi:hypothetical protein
LVSSITIPNFCKTIFSPHVVLYICGSFIGEAAKESLKLERTLSYQIVFEASHLSEEDVAIVRDFNSSNTLLTGLIGEEANAIIDSAGVVLDSETMTKDMIAERIPGPDQDKVTLVVSKNVALVRNVVPIMHYITMEARKMQNDLESAALILFTQEDEKERVEEHCTIQRSFTKI